MAKPGRRQGTPSEFRLEFARRIRAAREKIRWEADQMAAELSKISGRRISPDTYRKYESTSAKQVSLLPHDLILAFCDLTQTHPYALLAPVPFRSQGRHPADRRRPAA